MNYIKVLILAVLIAGVSHSSRAQISGRKNALIRKLEKVVWTVGLTGTVIQDAGKQFQDLFNIKKTWSSIWIPSKLDIDAYIDKGLSGNVAFTFSQLKAGKVESAHDAIRKNTENLIALDFTVKYDLNEIIGDTKAFSPYVISGFGYTYRDLPSPERKNAIMYDFGLGFNVWCYKGFGVNVQTMGKFVLNHGNGASNYLQHCIGVVYRFNVVTGYRTPGRLGHRYNLFRN